ncbi:MAG: tRNA epoxyqueuosine(34) reductase QueG, partial [Flammeovirgaceae bacterium]|nr:tRNA epoxyqueuosine(34) reductase QueG [Flammeovirgaceae bacterium]
YCGIAKAEFLEEEAPRLEKWLHQQAHGKMSYLAQHFDKRLNPQLLVPGAKSVISLMMNYYPAKDLARNGSYKIAKYAYGEDYHFVLKRKLKELFSFIEEKIGKVTGRVFVDSAPVMERVWAAKSGLGWIGKHTLLIRKGKGSFFFLAEIILDLELAYDSPTKDYCGSCRRCIEACPTEALTPYWLDANKCISYLTIELKEAIPSEFKGKMNDWIFGCDICQDVCPWNRFAQPHDEPAFNPPPALEDMTKRDWQELTAEIFGKIF